MGIIGMTWEPGSAGVLAGVYTIKGAINRVSFYQLYAGEDARAPKSCVLRKCRVNGSLCVECSIRLIWPDGV